MKQFPYGNPTNIMRHGTKFISNLAPRMCAPLALCTIWLLK